MKIILYKDKTHFCRYLTETLCGLTAESSVNVTEKLTLNQREFQKADPRSIVDCKKCTELKEGAHE